MKLFSSVLIFIGINMNASWPNLSMGLSLTTQNVPMGNNTAKEVSSSDIDKLIGNRKFNSIPIDHTFNMCPPIQPYDESEINELEEYCKKRGIIGVNFTGMRPSAVLEMLKGKIEGCHRVVSPRGVLHG